MTAATEAILEYLKENHPDTLLADGYEDALIGTVQQFNKTLACYSRERCIEILIERDDMSRDDAEECFEFNTQGSYVGELTPVFLTTYTVS